MLVRPGERGHQRFALAGHDTGMWFGCALATNHPAGSVGWPSPRRPCRRVSPSPPLFGGTQANDKLWHFTYHRLASVNEHLVKGRVDVYFGFQFAKPARKLPDDAVRGGGQVGNVVLITRNAAGQVQRIVANYRPRTILLHLSRLIGEQLAGTSYGEHFATSAPE